MLSLDIKPVIIPPSTTIGIYNCTEILCAILFLSWLLVSCRKEGIYSQHPLLPQTFNRGKIPLLIIVKRCFFSSLYVCVWEREREGIIKVNNDIVILHINFTILLFKLEGDVHEHSTWPLLVHEMIWFPRLLWKF